MVICDGEKINYTKSYVTDGELAAHSSMKQASFIICFLIGSAISHVFLSLLGVSGHGLYALTL